MNNHIKAKKKVEKLKGFYTHLIVYLVINTSLLLIKIIGHYYYGDYFMGSLWHFSTFASWLFWGVGLLFHALKVFQKNSLFSADWEERQIQKYLREDQND